jgi:hypothetical protein
VLQGGQELDHEERLVDHAGVRGSLASLGRASSGLGDRAGIRSEHEHREAGMRPTDGGRVGPRALVTFRPWVAVEDDALGPPAVDRGGDLIVIRDRHVLVSGVVEQAADEFAERRLVFDEQHPRPGKQIRASSCSLLDGHRAPPASTERWPPLRRHGRGRQAQSHDRLVTRPRVHENVGISG